MIKAAVPHAVGVATLADIEAIEGAAALQARLPARLPCNGGLRPFLEPVAGVDVSTLSLILLTLGLAGFVGTAVIGRFLKLGFYGTLTIIPVVMAAIAVMLIAGGASVIATTALLGIWGLVATAAPVGWWTWIARTLPQDAKAGGGLMVAVAQLSIAPGSTTGGLLFDGSGYRPLSPSVPACFCSARSWFS